MEGPMGSYVDSLASQNTVLLVLEQPFLCYLCPVWMGQGGSYLTTCVTCVLYLFFPAEHSNWQGSCYL